MSKRKRYASSLAKEHGFGGRTEYFDYIVESLVNGNRAQVKDLFNIMKKEDQADFLINHLDPREGIAKSVMNICIGELTN